VTWTGEKKAYSDLIEGNCLGYFNATLDPLATARGTKTTHVLTNASNQGVAL